MPYFLIIPAYVLMLLVLGATAFVMRLNPQWRPAGGYVLGGTIGTLPGFILANVLITLAGILPAVVAERFPPEHALKTAFGVIAGVVLLLGPFVASALGITIGFLGGAWWTHRLRLQASRRSITSAAL